MSDESLITQDPTAFWRNKYEKQKLLTLSIFSLFNKYGSSLEIDDLYREFLLTSMGHCLVGDACYFAVLEGSENLTLVRSYGRVAAQELGPISIDSKLMAHLKEHRFPTKFSELPKPILRSRALDSLRDSMSVMSPVYLEDRLLGLIVLGNKINGRRYNEFDLQFLNTICAVSAICFNNAKLLRNAKTATREVERLSNLRSEMMSRVSHEFRTPLTVIKSGLMTIELPDNARVLGEGIMEAVENLEELINSVLDLHNKYDTPMFEPETMFYPATLVQEAITRLREQAHGKNVTFEINNTSNIAVVRLHITRNRFGSIASHLIENAITFSNEGGLINVEIDVVTEEPREKSDGTRLLDWQTQTKMTMDEYRSLCELTGDKPVADVIEDIDPIDFRGPFLVLRITDHGIGIPDGELQFLGEPFRQASNSPFHHVKGKALGLARVQKILSRGGGRLYCRSVRDEGSTFTVYLPFSDVYF